MTHDGDVARTRAPLARVLAGLLALGLAGGCAFPAADSGNGDGRSAGPHVGECYDTPDAVLPEPHDPSPPIACGRPHTLQTFAVLRPDGAPGRQALTAAGERCTERLDDFLAGDAAQSALGVFYFTPTPAQRADGEHWVRCDVGVLTDTASTGTRRVTGSLAGAFSGGVPPLYRRCLSSPPAPGAAQPLVSCLRPHVAQQMPTGVDLDDGSDHYPGTGRLTERARPRCASVVREQVPDAARAVVVVPTETMWRAGARTAQCWATAGPGQRLNDSETQTT